ncbi:MAG TPA: glycosyl hydrolase family 28-related protein [Gemmatimonadales bacterium]|nr:glycosyl hydrolase family 28-related protein [Gemmatimonadales bacterium]
MPPSAADGQQQAIRGINVKEFGAKGDGATDDTKAFQAAINAADQARDAVLVPASTPNYLIGAPLALVPGIAVQGFGGQRPILRFAGDATPLFGFQGSNEAEGLNAVLAYLTLDSASPGKGTALRIQNFSSVFLYHVDINHFNVGLSAAWGIGVHLYACSFVHNRRGLEVGGPGEPGGIRGAGREADPFMDTVVVEDCVFSQNGLDINDMGSTRSLGGLVIRGSSFFEAYANPVPGKQLSIRIANRKGLTLYGNWFEGGQPSRTFVYLGSEDEERRGTGRCYGAAIFANDMLQTGHRETVGIDLADCEAATVFANCFEFWPGNIPIRLSTSGGANTIGQNAYLTYPDQPRYANPVVGALGKHQVLDPALPTTIGELQVDRRIASGVVSLAFAPQLVTDATSANYFIVSVTNGTSFRMEDPTGSAPGQHLTYDIRNDAGGDMGGISWGASFKLAGTFTNPMSDKRRTITFCYDGQAWVEIGRTTHDI